jgi:hypothetical protein
MKEIVDGAQTLNLISDQSTIGNLSQRERDRIFEKSYLYICQVLVFPDKILSQLDRHRIGDRSFVTVYESLMTTKRNLYENAFNV